MRISKMFFIYLFLVIVGLIVFALTYNIFSTQTGGSMSEHESKNYQNGSFKNLVDTPMSVEDFGVFKALYAFLFSKDKNSYPDKALPTVKFEKDSLMNLSEDEVNVTWFGHTTALFATKELTILTDPVFNHKRIPPLHLGPKPFPYENNYEVSDLPPIDILLLSHDHFDHLDKETIQSINAREYHVPLGVKSHLVAWGIEAVKIFEYDWYDDKKISSNTHLTFAPSRHFSGRSLFGRNKTLWGAWIVELNDKKIFFGGDSGYFSEFKVIGEKYGPFDLALLDGAQYNKMWSNVHMVPEESVQAAQDLGAKILLPVHWGKYVLSLHAWYEPINRSTAAAEVKGLNLTTPKIGQTFLLNEDFPHERWWEESSGE